MSPITYVLVVAILYTINAFLTLTGGFKQVTFSRDARFFQFIIWTGLSIWGWLIYF